MSPKKTVWSRLLKNLRAAAGVRPVLPGKSRGRRPRVESLEDRTVPSGAAFIGINDASLTEGDSGSANLVFTVTRSGDTTTNVTVSYSTSDLSPAAGAATAGADYAATSGTVTIPSGATSATVSVPVLGDTSAEGNETFFANLTGVTNVTGPAASFAGRQDFTSGASPASVRTADVNGDGKPDLVTSNVNAATVSVFLNTTPPGAATPTFAARQDFATGNFPNSVAVGDLNGDGKIDLVTANANSATASVLLNTTAPGAATPTFAARQDFATGFSPFGVAVGDVNGDGMLDLAVANNGSNSVSVFLNTTAPGAATPTFAARQDFATAPSSSSSFVVFGDLNGDGKLDLTVANTGFTVSTVSVFLNTTAPGAATPTFAARQDFATGLQPRTVAIGDLNGDGRLDLATANGGASTVSVLLNTTAPGAAAASFSPRQDFAPGNFPISVSIGDVNGDGKLDLAVPNRFSNTVSVFRNATAPGAAAVSFSPRQDFSTGSEPSAGSVGDVNGDGRADVLVANQTSGTVSVLLNTTAAPATTVALAAKQDFATGTTPMSVTTGDVNGDGKPDLISANFNSASVSVLLNTTAPGATVPTFAARQDFTVGTNPYSVAVGDVNGDGRPDLVVANRQSNTVSVLLNTTTPGAAAPGFAAKQDFSTGAGSRPVSVVLGDFNGDGRLDLATANVSTSRLSVFLNTTAPGSATATLAARQDFVTGSSPYSVAVGDVNGDGRPDLAAANWGANTVSVLLNTTAPGAAAPTFAARQDFATGAAPHSVAFGDLNGDGRADLAVANSGISSGTTVSVLLNATGPGDGVPAFSARQDFTVGTEPLAVAVGDVNGDGKPDLAAANYLSNTVSLLLNTTTPGGATTTFVAKQDFATAASPLSVALADLNGDGTVDVSTANLQANSVSVLLNPAATITDNQAVGTIVDNESANAPPVITSNGGGATAAVSVAENTTAVTTVTATDVNAGQTLTYSIVGGADAAKFSIVSSTGALRFVTAPDFEAPTDAGANNVYDVTVQVSDGAGGTDTQAIAVTVTPVNDNSPVFTSAAAASVPENTTAVLTVTATDADRPAQAVTFSITGGADAAKFTLSAGGALSFVTAPDFEAPTDAGANNVYDVTVTASDGNGRTTAQAIAVTVTGVNEAPVANPDAYAVAEDATLTVAARVVLTPSSATAEVNNADAPKTLDGNLSTFWQAAAENPAITYDLGQVRPVGGFRESSGAFPANPYTLFASADGTTFTQVSAGTLTPGALGEHVFPAVSARYLRLRVQRTDAAGFGELVEFQALVATGVLGNDTDPDGNALTAVLVGGPANGALTLNGDGSFTYSPTADFFGTDTFTYRAGDGSLNSSPATVTITVTPVNDAPSFTAGANQTVAEDAGPRAVANWATNVSAGPANEAGQAVQFQVTGNTNAALFGVQPAVAADGTLTYTPAPDANGSATITLRLADNGGTANGGQDASAAQTFTITVTAVNDRPVARDDTATTDEDAAVTLNVLANDSAGPATAADEASQTLSIVSVTQPAHGTAAVNDNGTPGNPADDYIVYTPAANYNGPDSFGYTVRDSGAPPEEAAAAGTITINPVNDRPTAAGATITTPEDAAVTIDLRALVADVETADADLTYTIVGGPSSGTLAATATPGVYTFTPAGDFHGTVGFTYSVADTGDPAGSGSGALASATAAVGIVVTPVNDAPVAAGDAYATNEDTPLGVAAPGVLANDADVDGDLLHAVLVTGPAHGSLALNPDGSFTYTPDANYFGGDAFTYAANDGTTDGNTVTVSLTVNSVNDAPAAANDAATTDEDTAVTVAVLANDADADGDTLAVTAVTQGAHGAVVVNGDNTVTYTPAADYFGSDTFTYTVSDGNGGTATATVTVAVSPVNDAPAAAPDAATTAEDTPVTVAVRGNDTDADGDSLAVVAVTQGSNGAVTVNGDGTVTYAPAANFHGTDTFTYTVSDGNGGTSTAAVTVTVTAVNDAPAAAADAYITTEDAALTVAAPGVLGNDADADGDALAAVLVSGPAHGTLALNPDGSFTYTPAANFAGTDSFTYAASDGSATGAPASVTITVAAVNDAPVAAGDSYTVGEDGTLSVSAPGVLANDTDADGDALVAAVVTGPAHGTLTLNANGSFTYTPDANYHGPDSFSYQASDGQQDSVAVVGITVTPVNDAPTAAGDSYATAEDTTLTVAAPGVLGNDADADGDALTALLVTGPAHGTLTLNANGSFAYTPAANYHGPDSFTYRASDGTATSAAATVSLTVTAVNDAPVAVGNSYTATAGAALAVAAPGVLVNDTDADGDALAAVLLTGPAHGTLTLNANGSFTYTPDAAFAGTDTFTYKATDGTAESGAATVTIVVSPGGSGVTLVPDPCDPGLTALVVRGTAGNDTITLTPSGNSGAVVVKLNGATLGTYNPTGRVIVYGLAGDDDLQTAGSVSRPVWLHGGAGDDRLKGGDGHDVLLGEDGDDLLVGNGGRDLLIGGEGADRIVGNAEDDVLIAGFTDHDGDDHALCAVMDEWTSARSFADRVANLKGGPGAGAGRANGTTYLNPETTHDDGREDVLTGSAGVDWYLFNEDGDGGAADRVTDMSTFEALFAADIDFIYVDPV